MKRIALAFLCLALPLAHAADKETDWVAQGDQKKARGDYKSALASYDLAIEKDPHNVRALLNRATLRCAQGDYAGAVSDDTQVILLQPKNAIAYTNRGNARAASGDLTAALADYKQAIALDRHHVRAFINRGNVLTLQKHYAAAISDYNSALKIEPKNALALYNRAGAERASGDLASAQADYAAVVALDTRDVRAILNLAILKMAARNWDAATADLQKCLSLSPPSRHIYARLYLWVIDVQRGKASAADQDLAAYLNQNSSLGNTWPGQIGAFLTGKLDQAGFLAAAATAQAKKNHGQQAQANYYIGIKCLQAGDTTDANNFFRKCAGAEDRSLHEYVLARSALKAAGGTTP